MSEVATQKSNTPEPAPLAADQRGAVVIIGVFAALALTGSLWFMIGIGDAIAFRENVQEAVDAASFSSAVVHARSMNFIAAVNLIMIGVTTIYLILAIISDLFGVALIACTTEAFAPCSAGTYGAVPSALETARDTTHETAENYKNGILRTTIETGDRLQTLVGRGAPWAASFAANRVGKKYDKQFNASTLGLSNAPAISGMGGSEGGAQENQDKRLGLPVTAKKAKALCEQIFGSVKLGKHVEKNSGNDFSRGFGAVTSAVGKAAEEAGTARYCGDDFWDKDGPKVVVEKAQNGSDYMQVYGFILGAKLKDTNKSEKAVGALAATKKRVTVRGPKSMIYLSQAEFFFDCNSTWKSSACNEKDGAMYMPAWKVRLRRMRSPVAGGALAAQAVSLLATGAASLAGQALGIPELDEAISGVTDMADMGASLSNQLQSFFTAPAIEGQLKDMAKGYANEYGAELTGQAKDQIKGAMPDDLKNLRLPGYFH